MMRILQIIGILIFITGCNSKQTELQRLWIGKYSVHHPNTENESISNGQRSIFRFESDSLRIKNFYFDFLTDENKIDVVGYQIKEGMILLNEGNKVDTLQYEISIDGLSLNYDRENFRKSVYENLSEYHLANRESMFFEFLISSSFEILDSVRVEFRDDASIIIPNFDFHLGDNQLWMIDRYEEELFLVIDGFFGFVLHVTEIKSDGFRGIVYGKTNREIVFKKLPPETRFKINNLIGEWIELKDEYTSPPPIFNEETEYFEREQLLITNSTIQKSSFFRVDTMKWEINREQDLIIIPDLNLAKGKKYWKIISLSEVELIIERVRQIRDVNGLRIERKVFERK